MLRDLAEGLFQTRALVLRQRQEHPQRADRLSGQGVGLRMQVYDLGAAERSRQRGGGHVRRNTHGELGRAARHDELHRSKQAFEF
jgi:hypothetical protein